MDSFDFGRYLRFGKKINQLYQQMLQIEAKKLDLSSAEANVLLFLANSPERCTARDACYYRGFSKAYVSKAVEGLSRRGYLRATPTEEDRRLQWLTLQAEAQPVIAHLRDMQQAFLQTLTEGLRPEEEALLWQVMERISNNLSKKIADDKARPYESQSGM